MSVESVARRPPVHDDPARPHCRAVSAAPGEIPVAGKAFGTMLWLLYYRGSSRTTNQWGMPPLNVGNGGIPTTHPQTGHVSSAALPDRIPVSWLRDAPMSRRIAAAARMLPTCGRNWNRRADINRSWPDCRFKSAARNKTSGELRTDDPPRGTGCVLLRAPRS